MKAVDVNSATAEQIMTPYVIMVECTSTFKEVIDTLEKNQISAIFIHDIKNDNYYIISQTDIIEFLSKGGVNRKNLANVRVTEFMKGPITMTDVNTPVDKMIRFMTEHNYKRVLISEDNKAVGVVSTRDIMMWNNTYFRPAKPQILLFMDNLTSNFISKHIFKDNLEDQVEKGLIDLYGGVLHSISMITNEVLKKSGGMRQLTKERRSILFEPYKGITGILVCDYNSIELRRKLQIATLKFYTLHEDLIQRMHKKSQGVCITLDISSILEIFEDRQER